MAMEFDESLMQDFLAESTELIEQLDSDLVRLERESSGPEATELLSSIFRALHTIKGAASFLSLETVTTFAHAAEDALNLLRKGEVQVTPSIIDTMLRSVDVLREMTDALNAGEEATACPQDLLDELHAIVSSVNGPPQTLAPEDLSEPVAKSAEDGSLNLQALNLPEQKRDLLSFMVADLADSSKQISESLQQARNLASRDDAASHLGELADDMAKTAIFFKLDDLSTLIGALATAAASFSELPEELMEDLLIRLGAIQWLIEQQAQWLEKEQVLCWPQDLLIQRVEALAAGQSLDPQIAGQHHGDPHAVLILDGVISETQAATATQENNMSALQTDADPAASSDDSEPDERRQNDRRQNERRNENTAAKTIRVEVDRLESLLNLVGQMVLTKNRILGISRRLSTSEQSPEFIEEINAAANDLDRLTGNLQVGVTRTRMQPLAKLFDRYPRVIRDIARATNKNINLEIIGKDTEVDKSVLELLADPLVHVLRNSADHGVEIPETRVEAGKSETGTIRLIAEHQGSHVRIVVEDNGKGIDREVIGRKAVAQGLTTEDQLATMPDEEVYQFIFSAGLSTAQKVSDLSGRGVGMDVVRTNVIKMNGTVTVNSIQGKSTCIEILIPLTVAIMPAMVVGVGSEIYCIPLQSIVEIVRPEAEQIFSVNRQAVMYLRESVLPLLDIRSQLGTKQTEDAPRFAVVVSVGGQRAGLLVDKLVGQQEVVIKPLDDEHTSGGPFSGATIQEDGEISLILDVNQLIRSGRAADAPARKKAA